MELQSARSLSFESLQLQPLGENILISAPAQPLPRQPVMRYVLPALPVSGPRGNRARRREAAQLAQHQGGGKTQRQDAAGFYGASASAKALCPRE
jgi:hypothetical protein